MPCCSGTVPIISERLASRILNPSRFSEHRRAEILIKSLEWLTARHDDVVNYMGITSRPYTQQERTWIALDAYPVASTPCPFRRQDNSCMLGGLGRDFTKAKESNKAPYLFLPMAIARAWARPEVRELAARCHIADAKVMFLTMNDTNAFPAR